MCIVIAMKKKKYPNLNRLCKCILPKERKTRKIIDTPVRAISTFWMTKHNISKASHCGLLGLARSNHDAIELKKWFFNDSFAHKCCVFQEIISFMLILCGQYLQLSNIVSQMQLWNGYRTNIYGYI